MDRHTFAVRLIEALAWPAVALIALFALRPPLLSLLRLLRSVKYGDVEIGFVRELREVDEAVTPSGSVAPSPPRTRPLGVPPHAPSSPDATSPTIRPAISIDMAKLAETSPRAAMATAWNRVGQSAIDAMRRAGAVLPAPDANSPEKVENALRQHDIITDKGLELIRKLRLLVANQRTRATSNVAVDYVILATRLADALDRWTPKRRPDDPGSGPG